MLAWAVFVCYDFAMTEWKPNGNPPHEHFEGIPTERQQYMLDLWEAQKHLSEQVPEDCKSCLLMQVSVMNHIAKEVIDGILSTGAALTRMRERTASCKGPQYDEGWADKDPTCPVVEPEKPDRNSCYG